MFETRPRYEPTTQIPFATLAPGKYNAVIQFKTSENQDSQEVIWIDVDRFEYSDDKRQWQNLITLKIAPNEFEVPNKYQDFNIPFTLDYTLLGFCSERQFRCLIQVDTWSPIRSRHSSKDCSQDLKIRLASRWKSPWNIKKQSLAKNTLLI